MLFFSPEIYQLLGELDFIEYIRRSSRDNEDKQMRSLEGQEMDLDLVISDYKIRIIDFLKESQSAFEMGSGRQRNNCSLEKDERLGV